jgi:excisionase family DNA binding protein
VSARITHPPARQYLSVKHSAEYADCSVFTIREKVDSGELPAYRLSDKPGSSIRIKRAKRTGAWSMTRCAAPS